MTTLHLRKSINPSPLRLGVLLIALAWFAVSPTTRAVNPPPDGGYPGSNTAEGSNALFSLTTGDHNAANGFEALFSNTTGSANIANGFEALFNNTTGNSNTANGFEALFSNTTGGTNTANGAGALFSNTTGFNNVATGGSALSRNTTGSRNAANGLTALFANRKGSHNVADGNSGLSKNTGNYNIGLGYSAGWNLTAGDNNIDIGNPGIASESNTIRIGSEVASLVADGSTQPAHAATFIAGIHGVTVASGVGVVVASNGQLGTVTSSARFKEAIKPMERASEAIFALQPVTFRYKPEFDPDGIPQFGLVAEQVEKVNPDLVVRGEDGKVMTVRYEAVNAMLLNEFLKEHQKVEKLECTVAMQEKDFKATIAQQRKQIEALTATVQKVSDQVALSKPAPQLVANP
jgi:hypothetical protein